MRNIPASEPAVNQEEPGEVDNRLSLVPSDFPVTETWVDGEEYDLSELGDAKLRQISPGEFKVVPGAATRQEAAEEEAKPETRRAASPAIEDMA